MATLKNPNVWRSPRKLEIETAFCQDLQKILLGQGKVADTLTALQPKIADILTQ